MIDIRELVRDNVRSLVPYSSARDEYSGKTGIFMDANENPYGKFNRYPDPYQKELRKAVSRFRGVDEKNIFLGNGSDEIIDLCIRTFCDPGTGKALIFPPTYGMYEVSAAVNNVRLERIPLDSGFNLDLEKVLPAIEDPELKLIFICSPNNPTGNSMGIPDIENIISRFRGIVLIDEAYIDFSDKPSFTGMISKYPNLIIMQTFSKALGLAGARIGMAFASPVIVEYFNRMKPPYNISTLNAEMARKKIRHTRMLAENVRKIRNERQRMLDYLEKIPVIEKVYPSDANFILVKVKDADRVYSALADRRIIVRNRSRLVPGAIRITVGRKSENRKLIKALENITL